MAGEPPLAKDLTRAQRWFADKGLGLRFSKDPYGVFWADLVRHPSGELIERRYGRGVSEADAAAGAARRFLDDQ
jgi:hypothetical protein